MTEAKRPLKVFLCHAHADRDAVRGLYTRLTNDGVDAWLDKEKLLPGQDWELEIRKAVRKADVVVVCLSKQFNQAGFRQKEVRLALDTAMEKPEGEIFIIPARLEECDTLESLRKWHWVDLFEEDGYEMLMRALRARANRMGMTLQVKRKRLPQITTSISKSQQIVDDKDAVKFKTKTLESKKDILVEQPPSSNNLPSKKSVAKRLNPVTISYIVIFLLLLGSLSLLPLLGKSSQKDITFTPEPKLTTTQQLISSRVPTSEPSETPLPIQTQTIVITPTAKSLPTEITDDKGVTMRLVPEGEFRMGNDSSQSDAQPAHQVYLDAFYIDIYEVTNAAYKRCADVGKCDLTQFNGSNTHQSYYGNPEFKDYPVIYVNWKMAKAYCEWRGARLPTEAEWEKAARGVDDRTYPWGENIDCRKSNYTSSCAGDTAGVGSYLGGVSPYGIYDMAGNVWEWVNDWYDSNYYKISPSTNPLGPSSGQSRVLRGGSWYDEAYNARAFYRGKFDPSYELNFVGFRCAMDATP